MQLALANIDVIEVGGDEILNEKKDRALWFAGLGTGGPAVMAGTMLLLNKIAMALFIGLGPLFVLCLLFEQTKNLFGRWLYYGLGTMFSLGVLSVMVTLSTDMVIAVAKSFWASSLLGAGPDNVSSMALQQGGLGLVMSMLILSAPPMAAMFFQGTLGTFSTYNAFANQAPPLGSGLPPGQPSHGYQQAAPLNQTHATRMEPPTRIQTALAESYVTQLDAIKAGPR
jgi:type IV secretion system protein VirB6